MHFHAILIILFSLTTPSQSPPYTILTLQHGPYAPSSIQLFHTVLSKGINFFYGSKHTSYTENVSFLLTLKVVSPSPNVITFLLDSSGIYSTDTVTTQKTIIA